jgi:peptidoglycan L-alanyl-D-glutamate endopeptidase CwlK
MMPNYDAINAKRLQGVHPNLVEDCYVLMNVMRTLGFPLFVSNGLRTLEEQAALYAQGRTKPGLKVTNVDGSDPTKATHSPQADGWGHAVDFAFDDPQPWADKHPWRAFGENAKALGLKWGGDWKTMKGDLGHVEL